MNHKGERQQGKALKKKTMKKDGEKMLQKSHSKVITRHKISIFSPHSHYILLRHSRRHAIFITTLLSLHFTITQ
jgi:hypothetical protein